MVDKLLEKKRKKIDYYRIIDVFCLASKFTAYFFKKKSKVSVRRQARAFLLTTGLNLEYCDYVIKANDIKNFQELYRFCEGRYEEFYL